MTHIAQLGAGIRTNDAFETHYTRLVHSLLNSQPVVRGAAHAMADDTTSSTHELLYLTEVFQVDTEMSAWQAVVQPNLPWAEDHFQERVGGEPLNPSPSEQWWPFARRGNAEHKEKLGVFSHTYPERFWPQQAGNPTGWAIESPRNPTNVGIRFRYGDLQDLVDILVKNPRSRQAYLPVWFPEDLAAARDGQRVPCSMGYHFLYNPSTDSMDCVYTMRSCDIVRFYRDDIYMAGRLLQWVVSKMGTGVVGKLVVHIDNLHCFPGDRPYLENKYPKPASRGKRSDYNFEALG